jgi:RNA polymerase sigma factor (sigma-70 family)
MAPSAEGIVIAHDELRRAVAALSATSREVLLLHYWDCFSADEIATIMGLSTGAASVRLTRAAQSVRAAVENASNSDVKN